MEFIIENIGWLLIIVSIAIIYLTKQFTGDPLALTSKYKDKLTLETNQANHKVAILEAMKKAGFRKVGSDENESVFFAQTKWSLWSFSEYIKVEVKRLENGLELQFLSVCALPSQMMAWGKNKRNFRRFKQALIQSN